MRTLDQIYMYQENGVELPTLYQRDSKGKVRQWRVWTEGATIVVEHGVQGGKLQQKRTVAKPKNTGKVNATTAEQQAVLEAQSKHRQQVEREDYNEDVDKAGLQTRPMLAHDYNKVPHRVNWDDVVGQPKLDGLRLVAGYRWQDRRGPEHVEMMTRKGETHNVDHLIDPAHELLLKANEVAVRYGYPEDSVVGIDGEVYLHGKPLQWINSRAKKYYAGETEKLEYHVFDLVAPAMPFNVRHDVLKDAFDSLFLASDEGGLVRVESCVLSHDNLDLAHGLYIEQGYEGLMIRHLSGAYQMGDRSADLFKYKKFQDEETKIIAVWEDKNGNAMLTCVRQNGVEVKVTPKRTHEERQAMLDRPENLIGKYINTKYQAETPDGSLQFPVGLDIREVNDEWEPIV